MRRLYLNIDNTPYYPVPKIIGNRIAVDMEKPYSSMVIHADAGVISLSDNKPVPLSLISDGHRLNNYIHIADDLVEDVGNRIYVILQLAGSEHGMNYSYNVTEDYYEFVLEYNGYSYINRYYYTRNYDTTRMIRFDVTRAIDYLLKIGKYNRFIYINPVIDSRYVVFKKNEKQFVMSNMESFTSSMVETNNIVPVQAKEEKSLIQKIIDFIK